MVASANALLGWYAEGKLKPMITAELPLERGVEAIGGASFDALVRRAVEESWGLFQLVPAQTSVEEVFVQLTKKDEAAA